jgi:small-conductance mechanosensitive channel
MTWASALATVTAFLQQTGDRILEHLPALLWALLLLIVGWALASVLRALSSRLLPWLYRAVPGGGLRTGLRDAGVERVTARMIGLVVFWVVFLLFITGAAESLGLPILSTFVGGLARYLPNVLMAALIVVIGIVSARIARSAATTAATSMRLAYAPVVGRMTQFAILTIAALVAADQIGIESLFLALAFGIAMWASVTGLALAFGLGARTTVSNILAAHYLGEIYQVGNRIRVGAHEGRIVAVTGMAVLLETAAGRVLVPAREFSETASVLLKDGA